MVFKPRLWCDVLPFTQRVCEMSAKDTSTLDSIPLAVFDTDTVFVNYIYCNAIESGYNFAGILRECENLQNVNTLSGDVDSISLC